MKSYQHSCNKLGSGTKEVFILEAVKKNLFTCSEYVQYPRSCLSFTCLLVGKCCPFTSISWSSTCAPHLIILIQMKSCLPKQLFPGNWIADEENRYYPNSLLPTLSNLGTGTLFSLHPHYAFFNICRAKYLRFILHYWLQVYTYVL